MDPVSELRELNAEIERLSLKMDSALRRLTRKD
jgi:outer membrane murein-binding lipoprotein Lpp